MFHIYIVRGSNLPAGDINGKSDPYCIIEARCGGKDIRIAKTKIIKKTLNPVWDQELKIPYAVNTTFLKYINIKVYDYDMIGSDDYLGNVKLDFSTNEIVFDRTVKYKLDTKLKTKGEPTIEVQIRRIHITNQHDPSLYGDRLVFYLEFNPPLNPGRRNTNISFLTLDLRNGGCCRVQPAPLDDNGIKVYHHATQFFPTGWTPLASINRWKIKKGPTPDFLIYVPLIEVTDNYQGVVILNCIGTSQDLSLEPIVYFQDAISFQGKDTISGSYLLHISDKTEHPLNKAPPGCLLC
ncbi:C2 domain containing protein [Histomonas meleagridis]|nr:C2 domain containing protein [Histomonas meleagridis]